MTMALQGKVAFITGGARGLGKAFAEALLDRGAKVSLVDIIVQVGKETEKELKNKYGADRVIFSKCDVSKLEDLRACYKRTVDTFGGLDIVINNAGIADEIEFERMIDINLTAIIRSSYMACNLMEKQKGGRGGIIINISSASGLFPSPHALAYTGVKHGVVGFSRALAINLRNTDKFGIRVATLCPAFTDTIMGNTKTVDLSQLREADITMPDFEQSVKDAFTNKMKLGIMNIQKVVDGMLQLVFEPECNGAVLSVSPIATQYFFPKRLANKL